MALLWSRKSQGDFEEKKWHSIDYLGGTATEVDSMVRSSFTVLLVILSTPRSPPPESQVLGPIFHTTVLYPHI